MSDKPKAITEDPAYTRKRSSGEVAKAYREKYDSVSEHTIPLVDNLNEQLDSALERAKERAKSDPPIDRDEAGAGVPLIDRVGPTNVISLPQPSPYRITVNGRMHTIAKQVLSYEEIAAIAFVDEHPTIMYRVRGSPDDGRLHPGDKIGLSDGLVINVLKGR